ncbi:MAG: hypothetical protein IPH32_11520 [Bacteroidetes bacterium]|nr:hypothetical protein [Bacteroidota bacterium]
MMRYFYIIFIFFCFKAKAQKLAPNFFSTTSSYYPYQTQSQSIVNYFDDYLVSHNVVRIDTIPFLNIELYDSNFNLVKNKFLKLLPSDGLLFYNNNPPLVLICQIVVYLCLPQWHIIGQLTDCAMG